MEATIVMKILVISMLLLAVAVHADTETATSIDSPPSDLLLPFPPLSCKDKCIQKCSEKKGFRRMLCIGKCFVLCRIVSPYDHAGYKCARDCVMNNLQQHHQPDIKSIDRLVNTCYSNCTKNV